MIKFIWKEIKKHWREDLIIILTITGIVIAIVAFQNDKNYRIEESQLSKTPFFKYIYSEENEAFVVEAEEDVSIHSIEWFFPNSEKSFDGYLKNSNQLTIDEIISKIWHALIDRKIYIHSPDSRTNTKDYIRCSILAIFDEYNSGIETDTGFPLGVLIEYTRKGGKLSQFLDIVLIKEFDSATPEVKQVKSDKVLTEDNIKAYMRKGVERLNAIIPIYPYDENKNYMENGKCTQTSTSWRTYFFNKEDAEAFDAWLHGSD